MQVLNNRLYYIYCVTFWPIIASQEPLLLMSVLTIVNQEQRQTQCEDVNCTSSLYQQSMLDLNQEVLLRKHSDGSNLFLSFRCGYSLLYSLSNHF